MQNVSPNKRLMTDADDDTDFDADFDAFPSSLKNYEKNADFAVFLWFLIFLIFLVFLIF